MIFEVNKTYAQVTPESCENGDYHEIGFIYEGESFSLQELIREIRDTGIENYNLHDDTLTIYGFDRCIDYKRAIDQQDCLMITARNSVLKRLMRMLEMRTT